MSSAAIDPTHPDSLPSAPTDLPEPQGDGGLGDAGLFLQTLEAASQSFGTGEVTPEDLLLSVFSLSVTYGISDIHFVEGESVPIFRVARACVRLSKEKSVFPDLRDNFENIVVSGLGKIIPEMPEDPYGVAWKATFPVGDRIIRAAFYKISGRKAVALRVLPRFPRELSSLGFTTPLITALTDPSPGLVLISGGTSCGKSSTLASLVDAYSGGSDFHIRILEDAPEYEYHLGSALITRQQIGKDVKNYSEGVEGCLVHDVNVLVFGELRDVDSIRNAIFASTLNMLVIATIHAPDVSGTISRLLEAYLPSDREEALRQLSTSLKVIVSQKMTRDRKEEVFISKMLYESGVFHVPSSITLSGGLKAQGAETPKSMLEISKYSKISSTLKEKKQEWSQFGCNPF